jgi:hypothetical protein
MIIHCSRIKTGVRKKVPHKKFQLRLIAEKLCGECMGERKRRRGKGVCSYRIEL